MSVPTSAWVYYGGHPLVAVGHEQKGAGTVIETQLLQQARMAIRIGDKATAQQLLHQVVHANPGNETAWLWLSAIIGDPEKERYCLQRVLTINPENEKAQEHLDKLKEPPPQLFEVDEADHQEPPEPVEAAEPPQRERSWYRSPLSFFALFLFLTPVWAVLVLRDKDLKTGFKILAGVVAAGYLILLGYVIVMFVL
jgi:hypothetical protein